MTIRERISEMVGDEAVTLLDPESLDEAIVGVFERCGQPPVVVYDYDRLREILSMDLGSDDDAVEWIQFNIEGAWIGERTPAIMHPLKREDDNE